MHKSNAVWLPLALPLLLVGCASDKNEAVDTPAINKTATQAETKTMPVTEDSRTKTEVDLEIKNDQIDQVEAINETIEENQLPVSSDTQSTDLSGTYAYDVTYATPAGNTDMTVTFALKNNVITDVNLAGNPQHQTSLQYETLLEAELGTLIIGKELSQVPAIAAKTAGSSLTPAGFNQALAQLQAES